MSERDTDDAAPEAAPPPDVPMNEHPRGLGMLFFAEMWERFSFYGMRGLLTLYLVKVVFEDLGNRDEVAAHTYGAYGALVYATPFVGGMLADRLLGYKRSVMLGAVLMVIGHAAMAIENEFFLYAALAFLIAGNGFFKPNISSMVGGLYQENDPRRDRGFTIFYMGINLGAFLQFIPAFLGQAIGWWLGFGLAGVGMLIGLFVFWRGKDVLGANGDPPDMDRLKKRILGPLTNEYLVYILAFLSVIGFAFMLRFYAIMGALIITVAAIGFLMVLVSALRSDKITRERLFVVLVLTFFNIVFWAFFEQAGSSMSLFTDRNVDREVFGEFVPAAIFQSVNPFFIIVLAPLFSLLWRFLGKRDVEPSMPVKFSIGLLLLGLGFLVMVWGFTLVTEGRIDIVRENVPTEYVAAATVPLFVLLGGYFFHTTGELCLSPIGLSMVTKLSPKKMVAMVMGLWFLSTSLSHHVAGTIAAAAGGDGLTKATIPAGYDALRGGLIAGEHVVDEATKASSIVTDSGIDLVVLASMDGLSRYGDVFWPIGWIAIGAGVVLLALAPFLKKWQHGIE